MSQNASCCAQSWQNHRFNSPRPSHGRGGATKSTILLLQAGEGEPQNQQSCFCKRARGSHEPKCWLLRAIMAETIHLTPLARHVGEGLGVRECLSSLIPHPFLPFAFCLIDTTQAAYYNRAVL